MGAGGPDSVPGGWKPELLLIDPRNRQERPLIKDSSIGWSGSAEVLARREGDCRVVEPAAGSRRVADRHRELARNVGLWPRPPDRVDAPDRLVTRRTLHHRSRWQAGGVSRRHRQLEETLTDAKILRLPRNGGAAETLVQLPFDEVGSVAMFPDGRRFVVTVYSSQSDVWVVDHFDVVSPPTIAQGVK